MPGFSVSELISPQEAIVSFLRGPNFHLHGAPNSQSDGNGKSCQNPVDVYKSAIDMIGLLMKGRGQMSNAQHLPPSCMSYAMERIPRLEDADRCFLPPFHPAYLAEAMPFGPLFVDPIGQGARPYRKPKRIRTAFSPSQLLRLESAFKVNHYVVGQERKRLAEILNLTETQVKVWFQNRRTKFKRIRLEEEEDGLFGSVERSVDENIARKVDGDNSTTIPPTSPASVAEPSTPYTCAGNPVQGGCGGVQEEEEEEEEEALNLSTSAPQPARPILPIAGMITFQNELINMHRNQLETHWKVSPPST